MEWFHNIQLNDGSFTNGPKKDYINHTFEYIDFKDKTVLDIGCFDGYFSLHSVLKGAKHVTAVDIHIRDTIKFVMNDYGITNITYVESSIYDFVTSEKYDVVLCYGVYYHLVDPLTALLKCFKLSNDIVSIEGVSHIDNNPSMYLLKPYELNNIDPSNVFSISNGFFNRLSKLVNFEIIKKDSSNVFLKSNNVEYIRSGYLLKKIGEMPKLYPNGCFPKIY